MQKSTDSALYWIGLSSIPGVGRVTFRKLVKHFASPERVLKAERSELADVEGLPGKVIEGIRSCSWLEYAEQQLKYAREAGAWIILADSGQFPAVLNATPDPPLFLYGRGDLRQDDCIAIVGTRKPTFYGLAVTKRISAELAASGLTVVSGMARGIDTQAHRGALEARGRTIAVLGCGIDVVYPPENRGLMQDISRSGAVITENAMGTQPEAGYFPARNRIISGLSRGTVIVEATQDSGSLITADYTREQGRQLFAVPGNVGSPASRGANSLIKQGALLIESSDDILRALGRNSPAIPAKTPAREAPACGSDEEQAFRCITGEPKHIDRILSETRMTAGILGGVLITLELKGLVKQLPGKFFVREDT